MERRSYWHPGCQGQGKIHQVSLLGKDYDEPSETYGINGGRISKLMIKIDGETVCNYDRGWDIHPTCKEAEMALCILLENHN